APGGKITFYTGIIRRLNLTDAEIAAVMGHEVAHALREHGREKVSLAQTRNLVTGLAFANSSNRDQQLAAANQLASILFTLPNSREAESEADRIGLELMARAGYDPSAAMSFWRKMAAATGGNTPVELLSTHPVHSSRIAELTALQSKVRPLYDAAAKH
ncbi:MAG: M48 family metallopeptidase, partial [Betaproteobacteria bacterium]|nr:M48 family metallopeptidase [Betaproteobacteria bacterium]